MSEKKCEKKGAAAVPCEGQIPSAMDKCVADAIIKVGKHIRVHNFYMPLFYLEFFFNY